jgi:hypothetical protein
VNADRAKKSDPRSTVQEKRRPTPQKKRRTPLQKKKGHAEIEMGPSVAEQSKGPETASLPITEKVSMHSSGSIDSLSVAAEILKGMEKQPLPLTEKGEGNAIESAGEQILDAKSSSDPPGIQQQSAGELPMGNKELYSLDANQNSDSFLDFPANKDNANESLNPGETACGTQSLPKEPEDVEEADECGGDKDTTEAMVVDKDTADTMNVKLPQSEPVNPEFISDTLEDLLAFSPDRPQAAREKATQSEDTVQKPISKGQQGEVSAKQLLQKKQPDRKAKLKKFDSQGHLVVKSKARLPQDVLAPHSQNINLRLEALRQAHNFIYSELHHVIDKGRVLGLQTATAEVEENPSSEGLANARDGNDMANGGNDGKRSAPQGA